MRLHLGTRGSALARWQAESIAARLRVLGHEVELVPIATRGDVEQSGPIGEIGTQGVFTKEIQRALLAREIDLTVHSLKDLPTEPVPGLTLACVTQREHAADVLVAAHAASLEELPLGAVVGTGSLRRQAQLLHLRPDLQVQPVRGNLDTRLRKLDACEFDALVLAAAGLTRLGLTHRIRQVLPPAQFLPAVGQGALGLEAREGDEATAQVLSRLEDPPTRAAVTAERALLHHLRGGCLAPVGAWGRIEEGRLHLSAAVLSPDGTQRADASGTAEPAAAEELGIRVAEMLIEQGAGDLIRAARTAP